MPLSFENADGTIRNTQKSEFWKIIIQDYSADFMDTNCILLPKEYVVAYIVDLMTWGALPSIVTNVIHSLK